MLSMLSRFIALGLMAVSLPSIDKPALAQSTASKRPWKGYSILGNGHLTAVYSDDPRISAVTHAAGVQHLYFGDYTADYVAATSFALLDADGKSIDTQGSPAVGMKNFFTAQTQSKLADGRALTTLCFAHPDGAIVLSATPIGSTANKQFFFEARLRKSIETDQHIGITSFETQAPETAGSFGLAVWSNGVALAVVPKSAQATVEITDSSVVIKGPLNGGADAAEVLLIPGSSKAEALAKVHEFQGKTALENEARLFWEAWMNAGKLPRFKNGDTKSSEYLEAYKRNLYCVKSANLNGQIPADITGQFVTNNMPQLYPRDAMMCARAFLATGHAAEAKQVIDFWAKPEIPMKTPGEWYARYDAHAKAVDGGSGARFDEPEWDANGYYIYLVNEYHKQTGTWLVDKRLLYKLADFIVSHLDPNGPLYEGGIVEWTGYLPATNMIDSAALKTIAGIAKDFGDGDKSATFQKASQRISKAMPRMFDPARQTYADLRFAATKGANNQSIGDKSGKQVYLWDTTANVGVIWGYPNHREIELSNKFYKDSTFGLDGGMRYFDSPDAGLAEYGHGFFFFTTAAAAEYEFLRGRRAAGKGFVDWMIRNSNSYGLMPEHVNPDGMDISPASPLSWCGAEFAVALLMLSQMQSPN
jgi:GH15 family glucan-1,4-alpha-glucosidase